MFHTCDFNDQFEKKNGGNHQVKSNLKIEIEEAAEFLRMNIDISPKIGIICGSGLGVLSDLLENKTEFPYSSIPNFPISTVQGHDGKLVFGKLSETSVVCMRGRLHLYEGYPLWKCTLPIRIMKELGIKLLITTNAAGGINRNYKSGDVMIFEDHIDLVRLFGHFSLRGPPNDLLNFKYNPVNRFYDKDFVENCIKIGENVGLKGKIHKGVYIFATGPNFESVADVKFLQVMGGDAVGASTVHEVIVAKDCGIKVIAFSLITNMCCMDYEDEEEIKHEDVLAIGNESEGVLKDFVQKIVEYVNETKLLE